MPCQNPLDQAQPQIPAAELGPMAHKPGEQGSEGTRKAAKSWAPTLVPLRSSDQLSSGCLVPPERPEPDLPALHLLPEVFLPGDSLRNYDRSCCSLQCWDSASD